MERNFYKSVFTLFFTINQTKKIKKKEKIAFSLTSEKEILVGLILVDLNGRFRYEKTSFVFKQGLIHQD